jgi:PAS domain S-box-containing protein
MINDDITKEELLQELEKLRKDYISLNIAYQKEITDRKLVEEKLREYNPRIELAMESADMAWWEMDISTGAVTIHKRKAEMLGFPPEQFKHYKDFMVLVHPDDNEKAMNAMRSHLEGLIDKYEIEYRILTKTGSYKWFYDIGSITKRDENGKPLKVAGLVLNISDRKEADESIRLKNLELTEINATKDKFFSIIAHD